MHSPLSGKKVFVSGASKGIGAATAKQYARLGASLFLIARNEEKLAAVAKECLALGASSVDVKALDVSDLQAFQKYWQNIKDIDIAVNNAGTEGKINDATNLTLEDYDQCMTTNVKAVWLATREQVKIMRSNKKKGSIVNVSSVAGLKSFAGSSLYCASKHAVIGLSKSIALEAAPFGIRVNIMCPGPIDTDMIHRIIGPQMNEYAAHQPLKRIGTVEEIARAIVWMSGPECEYMIGHCLVVDGAG